MNVTGIIPGLTGPGEVLVILIAILLLFFGSRRLPELARALGRSMSEFRKGREEGAEKEEKKGEEEQESDVER